LALRGRQRRRAFYRALRRGLAGMGTS